MLFPDSWTSFLQRSLLAIIVAISLVSKSANKGYLEDEDQAQDQLTVEHVQQV